MDLVAIDDGVTGHPLYWYENDGLGGFTRHLIDAGDAIPDNTRAVDINDGHVDILTFGENGMELA